MAIINLGSLSPAVGGGALSYQSFSYLQTAAYGVAFNIVTPDESGIFSFLRVRMQVSVGAQPMFFDSDYYDFEILNGLFLLKFPCSPLYRGDGTLTPFIERIPFIKGAGDGIPVQVSAFYDDAVTVPSWRA